MVEKVEVLLLISTFYEFQFSLRSPNCLLFSTCVGVKVFVSIGFNKDETPHLFKKNQSRLNLTQAFIVIVF